MSFNIILLLLVCFFLQASSLNLNRHDSNFDTCLYLPLGHLNQESSFKYNITQAWTADQAAHLKSGALNTSNFIHVSGWIPYSRPNTFFAEAGKKGVKIINHKLTPLKNVTKGSDAPEFYLSDADLQLAFGNPSEAKLYKVPSGKALVAVRFQAAVIGTPYVGRWSVLIDLLDDGHNLQNDLNALAQKTLRQIQRFDLTPRDVTSSLNIISPFVENSQFWTFSTSPAKGSIAPVDYQGYLMVIRAGQSFLAGPIADGQPNIIQVKDVVSARTECSA